MLVKTILVAIGASALTMVAIHVYVHVEPLPPVIPTVQRPVENDFFRLAKPVSDHYAPPVTMGPVDKP